MSGTLNFFVEEIDFKLLGARKLKTWLRSISGLHGKDLEEINYIFVSDQYLLQLNQEFLQHDTFTDIITFPHDATEDNFIGGDIYISIERVRENAISFSASFEDELHRVMVHGLLHLVGFGDKDAKAKRKMRALEDEAMILLKA
jgi:probable rRNA maturation factor